MLTYLIDVTKDLFAVSLVIGILFAFINDNFKGRSRLIAQLGLPAGLLAAGIRGYITNTQRLVGGWKVGVYGYIAALILLIVFVVLLLLWMRGRRKNDPEVKGVLAEKVFPVVTGLIMVPYIYCSAYNIFVYPFKFDVGDNGVLSTEYLFRLGGYLLGILVCAVAAVAVCRICMVAANKGYSRSVFVSLLALNLIYGVYCFARLMLVLTPRKIVDSVVLFNFAAASNNHFEWYTYLEFAVILALAVFLWVRSRTAKEPFRTKAERRKQRSIWRSGKRFTVTLAVCCVCAVLCATWFVDLNTVVIREAPVEDPIITKDASGEDEYLCVPLESVSDGHLHRFGYTTPDGNPTRFIVVLKQENTSNYGIGLDACEICGEAGYYENKDGQVVCKKCNVVMNRTTIGMKGGCNPLIIDYDIDEGQIIVPVSEMIKNQDRFKK